MEVLGVLFPGPLAKIIEGYYLWSTPHHVTLLEQVQTSTLRRSECMMFWLNNSYSALELDLKDQTWTRRIPSNWFGQMIIVRTLTGKLTTGDRPGQYYYAGDTFRYHPLSSS